MKVVIPAKAGIQFSALFSGFPLGFIPINRHKIIMNMKRKKSSKTNKFVIKESTTQYYTNKTCSSFESFPDNVIHGDNLSTLQLIPDNKINLIVTSPPYFKQRDYGSGIGNEKSVEDYIENLKKVFAECVRILKDDGSIVFNLGDKYLEGNLQLIHIDLS